MRTAYRNLDTATGENPTTKTLAYLDGRSEGQREPDRASAPGKAAGTRRAIHGAAARPEHMCADAPLAESAGSGATTSAWRRRRHSAICSPAKFPKIQKVVCSRVPWMVEGLRDVIRTGSEGIGDWVWIFCKEGVGCGRWEGFLGWFGGHSHRTAVTGTGSEVARTRGGICWVTGEACGPDTGCVLVHW